VGVVLTELNAPETTGELAAREADANRSAFDKGATGFDAAFEPIRNGSMTKVCRVRPEVNKVGVELKRHYATLGLIAANRASAQSYQF
jgi:hypothetical protein